MAAALPDHADGEVPGRRADMIGIDHPAGGTHPGEAGGTHPGATRGTCQGEAGGIRQDEAGGINPREINGDRSAPENKSARP